MPIASVTDSSLTGVEDSVDFASSRTKTNLLHTDGREHHDLGNDRIDSLHADRGRQLADRVWRTASAAGPRGRGRRRRLAEGCRLGPRQGARRDRPRRSVVGVGAVGEEVRLVVRDHPPGDPPRRGARVAGKGCSQLPRRPVAGLRRPQRAGVGAAERRDHVRHLVARDHQRDRRGRPVQAAAVRRRRGGDLVVDQHPELRGGDRLVRCARR
ncbi:MAG: Uncharacterized protein FD127_3626 [Acidimicrobiaceae bacterium]|nr:MAG: Uncharacterized protein FD127_3626 [Acidimicrobiaceae bacterium]